MRSIKLLATRGSSCATSEMQSPPEPLLLQQQLPLKKRLRRAIPRSDLPICDLRIILPVGKFGHSVLLGKLRVVLPSSRGTIITPRSSLPIDARFPTNLSLSLGVSRILLLWFWKYQKNNLMAASFLDLGLGFNGMGFPDSCMHWARIIKFMVLPLDPRASQK
jgi:hypothetical protein